MHDSGQWKYAGKRFKKQPTQWINMAWNIADNFEVLKIATQNIWMLILKVLKDLWLEIFDQINYKKYLL